MAEEDWLSRLGGGGVVRRIGETVQSPSTLCRRVDDNSLSVMVFLGAFLFLSVLARLDVFLNDTYAIANTLLALSGGEVVLTEFVWGPQSGDMPGVYYADGVRVGRNYGLAAAALPVYFLLTGLSLVFELHSLLIGAWAFLLYAFLWTGHRNTGIGSRRAAGAITIILFLVNVSLSEPLPSRFRAYVSLLAVVMAAAAGTAVVIYKMFESSLGQRQSALVGLFTVVGTPVAFQATIAKRHSFTVFFLTLAMFGLYRSRTANSRFVAAWYSFLTYATVGGLSWINGPEGFVLFIAVFAGDFASTRTFRPKEVAFSLAGLLVSLVPFFLTNYLISGNPLKPPRLFPDYRGQPIEQPIPDQPGGSGETGSGETGSGETGSGETGSGETGSGETGSGETGSGETGSGETGSGETGSGETGSGGLPDLSALIEQLQRQMMAFVSALYGGVLFAQRLFERIFRSVVSTSLLVVDTVGKQAGRSREVLTDGNRLSRIFIRRGYVDNPRIDRPEAVNLSVLESMPALGMLSALLSPPPERTESVRQWIDSPFFPADVTGLVFVSFLGLLTLTRLPYQASFTVRYLHALYVVGIYFLVRSPRVSTLFSERSVTVGLSCLVTVLIGLPLYGTVVRIAAHVPGEAVQLYAIPAFCMGVALAGVGLVWLTTDSDRVGQLSAVLLGVSFGLAATYALGTSIVVYGSERNFLPIIELLSKQFEYTT